VVQLVYHVGRKVNWLVEDLTASIKAEFHADLEDLLSAPPPGARSSAVATSTTASPATVTTATVTAKLNFEGEASQ